MELPISCHYTQPRRARSEYPNLVTGCGGDARAVATLLMVEKIEQVVERQVEAIKNLKID